MSNSLYPKFKQRLLDPNGAGGAAVDLNTDTIKIRLLTAASSYNAAHEFLNELAGSGVGTDQVCGSPTVVNGVFDCADPTWTAVAAGDTITAYVVYKDTGNAATSNLIAWFDHDASSNSISIATNGGDITLTVNASGVFAL